MKSKKQRFLTFFRLPGREKMLFLEALSLHLMVGLMLKFLPFKRIPGIFSSRRSAVSNQNLEVLGSIRIAIQRASLVSPWKNKCLVSSLAGRCMLRRRRIPSRVFLGMARSETGRLAAHAWLISDDTELVQKNGHYTELYTF